MVMGRCPDERGRSITPLSSMTTTTTTIIIALLSPPLSYYPILTSIIGKIKRKNNPSKKR